jgi:NitT/TauT family transport system substrate-binding protein
VKRKYRRVFCAVTLGILLASFVPGSVLPVWAAEKVSVVIISLPFYSAWYIVKEKKMAKDIDLTIRVVEDIREKNALITRGEVQVMLNTMDAIIAARAAGVPITMVAVPAMSYGLDEMVVTRDIHSERDFPGKKYGTDFGYIQHMWMLLTLRRAGIPFDALKLVVALPQDSPSLFLTEQTDIDVNNLPFSLQSQRRPGSYVLKTSFTDKTWERGLIGEAIAYNDKWLAEKPKVAKELLRAWFEAVNWWKENPEEGDKIVARGLGWRLDDVKETMNGSMLLNIDQNLGAFGIKDGKPFCMSIPKEAPQPRPEASGWGRFLFGGTPDCVVGYVYDTWKLFNEIYLQVGIATRIVDPKEAIDPSLLEDLAAGGFREKYNSNRWIGRIGP